MIKSMTGYGRAEAVKNGKKISVEMKSVNHRYSDYTIRVPRYFGFLEEKVREYVAKNVFRGKVDIFVNIESYETADKEIILNSELAKSYIEALIKLRDEFNLKDDISVSVVARCSDIFKTEQKEDDEEQVWSDISEVLTDCVNAFIAMREREGERINKDLVDRVNYMKTLACDIDERSPETVEEYKQRLYAKIKDVLDDRTIDEARVLTEVAIFADKVAVNEEIVRLASHFDEFFEILSANEPAGRKLDFLVQEINREINTIGSKANDIVIAKKVVELKAELEKLREQIQNIE